ncbi:Tau95 domain-containing protein [Cephalotus follicularis]|uniref:Tau95 domain-containing protein n=1 Tax=Cephalotus follicularis TaxID=3775 RepID=A0A1Q3BGM0_CEPFO|nr:Tau95 domain-containing protein [Cephalotus follicularis]
MGIIEDGKIKGTIPSSESFAVHYPGYPSSLSRAVQTLGGIDVILKAHSSQSNKLELRFRPEDPYSHPAFGELRHCNNLLLKISKKKSFDGQKEEVCKRVLECSMLSATDLRNEQQLSENETELVGGAPKEVEVQKPEDQISLSADIVARVSESYHFDGMADYQHVVAVHADVARRKKRNWAEVEEPQFEKCGLLDVDQEDVMLILPPLFSLKDVPETVVLRPSATLSSKKKQEGVLQNHSEIDVSGLAIDFSIKEIPKKINWEEYTVPHSELWKGQMAVSKLFDERPIWHKESLIERLLDNDLKFSHQVLKRFLLGVAYYFSNGPFLRFWIKKGYDPRTDPESRIYQRTDFRLHPRLQSYRDANLTSDLKNRWEDLCAFRVFPLKFHTSLQLFELEDDYIQQEIRKPTKKKTCDCKSGWFSVCVLDSIRHRVTMRFLSVYPGPGAEKYLKTASDDFEKSKRMCIKDALKIDDEEHQQGNRENIGNVDKDKLENVDDDEEDEIAVNDGEDESDVYEALDLDEEEDEISLQSESYLDLETNSRTYLQEIFGAFPSNEAGGAQTRDVVDTSDEEYQIYERDSDENYSDDDD